MKIKNSYNAQAAKDFEILLKLIKEEHQALDLKEVDEDEAKLFLKNWFTLEAISYRTLKQEHEQLNTEFVYEGESAFGWYFAIRAADEFIHKHQRHPAPADKNELSGLAENLLNKYFIDQESFSIEDRFFEEM